MTDPSAPDAATDLRSRVAVLSEQGYTEPVARAVALKERIGELSSATSEAIPSVSESMLRNQADGLVHVQVSEQASTPRRDKFASLPGWFISAVLHSTILVGLACVSARIDREQPPLKFVAPPAHQPVALKQLPPILIKPPPVHRDPLSLDDKNDPGLIKFGAPPVIRVPTAATGILASSFSVDEVGMGYGARGSGLALVGKKDQGAEFCGVQASGNTFVFIVDSSISMSGKVADVRRELEYAIRRLSKHQEFYVLFFDGNTERMRLGKWNRSRTRFEFNSMPERDLVPASNENIDAFVRWLPTVRLEFNTNPYEATAFTLNKLKPEVVFLLSDGEFTDRGMTESFLRVNNVVIDKDGVERPKCVIHCIGFYSRAGEITLQRIAKANGGTYRFVEPPAGYVPRFQMSSR